MRFLVLIFAFTALLLIAASRLTPAETAHKAAVAETFVPTQDPVKITIAAMSIEEKVGQLLIAGHWRGSNYYHTSNLIRAYGLGGVIIMDVPLSQANEVPTWVAAWQRDSELPLMVAIDQEGGLVSRLKSKPFLQTAQPEITDSAEALNVAQKRGGELHELGINTNFAPVLEESINPFAFLYDRTFRDPNKISALGKAMIVGMRGQGVVAVPKHFPGHEDTPTDSHHELPVLSVGTSTFSEHIADFTNVINVAKPEALMTAHVLIPAIDPELPATLSPVVLTETLRNQLGFNGVIITDDMSMGAISNHRDPAEAALQAILAGADMILFAAEPNQVITTRKYLLDAVASGELTEARLDESLERILTMKTVYEISHL